MRRGAAEAMAKLNLPLDVTRPLSSFPIAIQQMVAIARAVDVSAKVLILDEPTSSLDRDEVARLFDVMRRLKAQGLGIVFVTHFLDQVYEICDRMTVLRNGRLVGEYRCSTLDARGLVAAMVGRELAEITAPVPHQPVQSHEPAALASIERMRACAWIERRSFACSMRGRVMSSA